MSGNHDELVAPEWLDSSFLEGALRKYKNNENLAVLSFVTKPGSNVGDHFASIMFRIVAKISDGKSDLNEVISLILKTMPIVEGVKMDFLRDSSVFDVEIRMYADVLPKMEPLLEACGIQRFWPKLVYQALEPVAVIVFEDLSVDGYTVPKELLTMKVGKSIFSRLAGLHAVSYYMHHEQNYDFSGFNKGLFDLPRETTDNFFGLHMDIFIEEIGTWPGYEVYVKKLKVFRQHFMNMGLSATRCSPNGYNVLNHGDFHSKNLLFKLSKQATADGGPIDDHILDFILLDYQMSLWTSPGYDLIDSLYLMMLTETRDRRDELIKHYHDEFCSVLKKLKFTKPTPTLLDLNKELERFGFLEVIICVCFLPFMYIDYTKGEGMADLIGETDSVLQMKRSMFKNEKYHEIVKKELPRLLKMGFMEIPQ